MAVTYYIYREWSDGEGIKPIGTIEGDDARDALGNFLDQTDVTLRYVQPGSGEDYDYVLTPAKQTHMYVADGFEANPKGNHKFHVFPRIGDWFMHAGPIPGNNPKSMVDNGSRVDSFEESEFIVVNDSRLYMYEVVGLL